jgi:hypothetical protein
MGTECSAQGTPGEAELGVPGGGGGPVGKGCRGASTELASGESPCVKQLKCQSVLTCTACSFSSWLLFSGVPTAKGAIRALCWLDAKVTVDVMRVTLASQRCNFYAYLNMVERSVVHKHERHACGPGFTGAP